MTPPTTPTTIPTRGNFLEPGLDVELDELLDGTLEDVAEVDMAEVAPGTLVRAEVADAFWTTK